MTNNPFEVPSECETYFNGMTTRGLSGLMTNVLYYIRLILINCARNHLVMTTTLFDSVALFRASNSYYIIGYTLAYIVRPVSDDMRVLLMKGILDKFKETASLCLVIMILYLICIFIIGVLVWKPFIVYLSNTHTKVRRMLEIGRAHV